MPYPGCESRHQCLESRSVLVRDALVGAVVGVHEEGVPALRQLRVVDGEAVVLRGDVAAARSEVDTGLVPLKSS